MMAERIKKYVSKNLEHYKTLNDGLKYSYDSNFPNRSSYIHNASINSTLSQSTRVLAVLT